MGMIQKGFNQIIVGIGTAKVASEARMARESAQATQLSQEGASIAKEGDDIASNPLAQGVSPTAKGDKDFEGRMMGAIDRGEESVQNAQRIETMAWEDPDEVGITYEGYKLLHGRDHGKFRKEDDIKTEYYNKIMEDRESKMESNKILEHNVQMSQEALQRVKTQYNQLYNQRIAFQERLENFKKQRAKLVKRGYNIPDVEENK